MVKEKSSLINGINYQGKFFKLILCFTVTLLVLSSLSFYKEIHGQNLNSSTFQGESANSIKNMDAYFNTTKESPINSGKNFSSSLPDLFNYVKESVVQITDPANIEQQSDIVQYLN